MTILSVSAPDAHRHPRLSTPRRWPAIGLWLFFTAVTAYTLLSDVLRGVEPFQPGHLLAVGALVAALAAGHYAWPELRSGHLPAGILLALVAVAATAYVVVSTASRNAETAHAKSARIEAANTARETETRQLRMAEAMLAEALRRVAAECATGNGSKCKGAQATEHVYRAAIDGHKARLDKMAPALPPNGGYAHAARFIASLPGITAPADAIERRLVETVPTLSVLINELAAIAFGIMAFRTTNRTVREPARAITERPDPSTTEEIDDLKRLVRPGDRTGGSEYPDNQVVPANRKVPIARRTVRAGSSGNRGGPSGGARVSREQAEADLVTMLALGQSVPSQEALCRRWRRPSSTVSDWLHRWETDGLIPSRRLEGRTKTIAAA